MVDEELAMQVIDLVLETAREQLARVDLERRAVAILGPNDDAHRALDVGVDIRNREAAFFALLRSFTQYDLGIDDDVLRAVHVDDGDTLGAAHLRGGETNSLRGVHRL